MRVLLVEDMSALAELTMAALQSAGFVVDHAATLSAAVAHVAAQVPDVIVLDLGLPDGDGSRLIMELRRAGMRTPILVVTARGGLNDRIEGLDGGADDYVVKPVAPAEIAARCRALLRRPDTLLSSTLTVGALVLDTVARAVRVGPEAMPLGRRDVAVLEVLMRRAGAVATRAIIEDAVYALEETPGPNALEAAVSRIRKALQAARSCAVIHTVRGVGYMLEEGEP
jgi:two-component system OmpR family response regulator